MRQSCHSAWHVHAFPDVATAAANWRAAVCALPLQVCKQTIAARRSLAHEWKIFKDLVGTPAHVLESPHALYVRLYLYDCQYHYLYAIVTVKSKPVAVL
jgi:hypothetical protein